MSLRSPLMTSSLQKTDARFMLSYLIKYVSGAEEKKEVTFEKTKEKNVVKVVEGEILNKKITSQKILADKRKEDKNSPLIREIGQTEILWFLLGFAYVITTCKFIHIPAYEAADRSVILKRRKERRIDTNHEILPISCRSDMTDELRKFTANQKVMIREQASGQFAMDSVMAHSIRPPELMPIDWLIGYSTYFVHSRFNLRREQKLPDELRQCPWIDGAGRQIKVRAKYLPTVIEQLCARRDLFRQNGVAEWDDTFPLTVYIIYFGN
jgi:hypothetical protein